MVTPCKSPEEGVFSFPKFNFTSFYPARIFHLYLILSLYYTIKSPSSRSTAISSSTYTIKLSYSSSILDTLFIPISSAKVSILDNEGNEEILVVESPGNYKTRLNGIQGIIGRSYKISIQLEDGNIYESDYEKLLDTVSIEKVYFENEWQYAQNESESSEEGLQFYANYKPVNLSAAYFFWEIEETYEYHSSFRIYLMLDGTGNNNTSFEGIPIKEMPNADTLYYCWKTQKLNETLSYDVESLDAISTKKLPLHFVPMNDERLRWGYNISVKQYAISEEAFIFLDYLKKQNENQGGIFSSQPFQITGNVHNIQNPSELVLGYFMVASGTVAPRIQTRAQGGLLYERQLCDNDSSVSGVKQRLENMREEDLPLFLSYYHFDLDGDPLLGPILIVTYFDPTCLDCRRRGGVTLKPEFWEW